MNPEEYLVDRAINVIINRGWEGNPQHTPTTEGGKVCLFSSLLVAGGYHGADWELWLKAVNTFVNEHRGIERALFEVAKPRLLSCPSYQERDSVLQLLKDRETMTEWAQVKNNTYKCVIALNDFVLKSQWEAIQFLQEVKTKLASVSIDG